MRHRHSSGFRVPPYVVVLLIALAAFEFYLINERDAAVQQLGETLNATQDTLEIAQSNLEIARARNDELTAGVEQRDETIQILRGALGLAQTEIEALTPVTRSFYVVGVRGDGSGIVLPLRVNIVKGTGSISVNIKNVDLQAGVQASIRTAADVADAESSASLTQKDITVSFINEGTDIVSVDGPSAGAAIAATIVAALENRQLKNGVLLTGTIEENGNVGPVGGITAKAEAAQKFGADTFLVPDGERVSVAGLEVLEVDDIDEVLAQLLD